MFPITIYSQAATCNCEAQAGLQLAILHALWTLGLHDSTTTPGSEYLLKDKLQFGGLGGYPKIWRGE